MILASLFVGAIVGLLAGTFGGVTDTLLMRLTDLCLLSLPGAILAIAVVAAIGPFRPRAVRPGPCLVDIVRACYAGEVTRLRASPHAEAAKLVGLGNIRLGVRHLLPGAVPPLVVTATLDLGALILALSGLSFLGLGAPQPAAELGAMTQQGLPYLLTAWWVPVMPAIGIALLVLTANFAGDGFRASWLTDDAEPSRPRHRRTVLTFVLRRVIATIPIILSLLALIFLLEHVSPVDPARAFVGPYASSAVVERERVVLGLNRPFSIQYLDYLGRLVGGNLGTSAVTRQPIWSNILHFLPATLELIVAALLIAAPAGIILGIASAKRWRGSGVSRGFMVTLSSFPIFLTALFGILLFYYKLHWLPATGQTSVANPPAGPNLAFS